MFRQLWSVKFVHKWAPILNLQPFISQHDISFEKAINLAYRWSVVISCFSTNSFEPGQIESYLTLLLMIMAVNFGFQYSIG